MAMFKATEAQAAAVNARNASVLVSAGAGSGKTRVLTERLMGYICAEKPVDIDSFLIITFTRAAAAELRGRIMDELASRLAEEPMNRRLRRQSALCRRTQIGTIDSFCTSLLRENCHAAGLSPDFKIVDDERASVMKAEALERTLEDRYEHMEELPAFKLLVDSVGAGRDDKRLAELTLELHTKMQCHARPEAWARGQLALLKSETCDLSQTPWGREVLEETQSTVDYWADEFEYLIGRMQQMPRVSKAYSESLVYTAERLRELSRCLRLGWDRAREQMPVDFPKLKSLTKPDAEESELAELVKSRRKKCTEEMKKLYNTFYSDSSTLLSEMRMTAPAMEELLQLALDFDSRYEKDKRAKSLVDYADLEHLAAKLLTDEEGRPTELARKISLRYTEIMIDEYQDVSRVQDTIFAAISNQGRNLFMVGDVKQSIYRFRLADPSIFTEKYLSYADEAKAQGHEPRRILLRENFRSRREVIDAANAVFSLCMSRRLGDMDYDENQALICGAAYEGQVPKPELCLLSLPKAHDSESPDKITLEAEYVARRIIELVSGEETVSSSSGRRRIQYGDIAILLRSANTTGPAYRRTLMQWGIPVASVQGSDFFESFEVSTVMAMLSVVDNPHKDIPLVAVLRSPSLDFSPDELSDIRAADKKADLYTALLRSAESNEKCKSFVELLSALREAAVDMSAAEITWAVIEKLDMLALCAAMRDGERRRSALMALLQLSEGFEATGYRGLHRFNLWLTRMSKNGKAPSTGGSFSSAVQIMSIHASKGLEFPVVFVSDLNHSFNTQDSSETVLIHPELGLGPKLTDIKRNVEYPTLARHAIKLRLNRELMSEEMRLLYVALTRAKERLIMTATEKDVEKLVESAKQNIRAPMPAEILCNARSHMSWLVYAALSSPDKIALTLKTDSAFARELDIFKAPSSSEIHADNETLKELERKLSFTYPKQEAVELPSKLTATELKGRIEADEDAESFGGREQLPLRMPQLSGEEKKISSAERGIATHLVLQYMDFNKADSRAGIEDEIKRLEHLGFISKREAEAVNASAIEGLFSSSLGRRMLAAQNIMREFKFSLLVDASKLYANVSDEQLLLQGVVDCCIEEAGELVIIDYKTDYIKKDEDIRQHAKLYRAQLMAYAEAMSRICGKRVKECVLFFLQAGKSVTVY